MVGDEAVGRSRLSCDGAVRQAGKPVAGDDTCRSVEQRIAPLRVTRVVDPVVGHRTSVVAQLGHGRQNGVKSAAGSPKLDKRIVC